jgi:hypothetical protein
VKKVVIIPGVGLHKDTKDHYAFLSHFHKAGFFDAEIFWWAHDWPIPDVENGRGIHFKGMREWIYEVILDFQQVALHAFDTKLPPADVYVGHSAGSILALAQHDTPAIVFGSPAVLIESLGSLESKESNPAEIKDEIRARNTGKSVLNILNVHDVLAYPLNFLGTENYFYSGPWWNPRTFNPIRSHYDYWGNKKIINKMIDHISTL